MFRLCLSAQNPRGRCGAPSVEHKASLDQRFCCGVLIDSGRQISDVDACWMSFTAPEAGFQRRAASDCDSRHQIYDQGPDSRPMARKTESDSRASQRKTGIHAYFHRFICQNK
ncbi:MAG TPA: hypothetical protein DCG12_16425 [Planctomycetaceae bacterium]|nr:hypothetical protein [Planctomycetaceae bacterium]